MTAGLSLGQATALKERARLESAIRSRDEAAEQRDKAVAALRRHNRKLAKMPNDVKGGVDIEEECSAQDRSPKSSFADRAASSS